MSTPHLKGRPTDFAYSAACSIESNPCNVGWTLFDAEERDSLSFDQNRLIYEACLVQNELGDLISSFAQYDASFRLFHRTVRCRCSIAFEMRNGCAYLLISLLDEN